MAVVVARDQSDPTATHPAACAARHRSGKVEEMTVVLPEYLDENLEEHFKNDVLAALRRIPAERRQAAMREVIRRTTVFVQRRPEDRVQIVSTGVDQSDAWRDYLAENGY